MHRSYSTVWPSQCGFPDGVIWVNPDDVMVCQAVEQPMGNRTLIKLTCCNVAACTSCITVGNRIVPPAGVVHGVGEQGWPASTRANQQWYWQQVVKANLVVGTLDATTLPATALRHTAASMGREWACTQRKKASKNMSPCRARWLLVLLLWLHGSLMVVLFSDLNSDLYRDMGM